MNRLSNTVQVIKNPKGFENTNLQYWAKISPLLAALIAPITSLLDIPAMTVSKIYASDALGLG
jgi:potassium channel subfamily K